MRAFNRYAYGVREIRLLFPQDSLSRPWCNTAICDSLVRRAQATCSYARRRVCLCAHRARRRETHHAARSVLRFGCAQRIARPL